MVKCGGGGQINRSEWWKWCYKIRSHTNKHMYHVSISTLFYTHAHKHTITHWIRSQCEQMCTVSYQNIWVDDFLWLSLFHTPEKVNTWKIGYVCKCGISAVSNISFLDLCFFPFLFYCRPLGNAIYMCI